MKVSNGTSGKAILQRSIREAHHQGCGHLVLRLKNKPNSYRKMYNMAKYIVKMDLYSKVQLVTIIYPNNQVKLYKRNDFKR